MPLRLLLEAHFDKGIGRGLREGGVDAQMLGDWHGGALLAASDREILLAAYEDKRTLVTFDVSTIPEELDRLFLEGRSHSGVIFVSHKTFRANDIGGIATALARLALDAADLTDSVRWLATPTPR